MNLWLVFFLVHLIACSVFLVLRVLRLFKTEYIMVFAAYLLPVWGLLMIISKRISDCREDRMRTPLDVERPAADGEKRSVTVDESPAEMVPIIETSMVRDSKKRHEMMLDILYDVNKSIVMDQDDIRDMVVPLEEALVVNDKAVRRSLIIDVLYSNPRDYVSQIYDAKANGDTEVVHYAATALAELQKEFDIQFQEISKKKALHPADGNVDMEYQLLLEKYISSDLLEGDALHSQLKAYSGLLGKKLESDTVKGRWSLINKKADADLRLGDKQALDEDVAYMVSRWPERENSHIYNLKSAVLKKDIKLVRDIIRGIRERFEYMSPELTGEISFWEA